IGRYQANALRRLSDGSNTGDLVAVVRDLDRDDVLQVLADRKKLIEDRNAVLTSACTALTGPEDAAELADAKTECDIGNKRAKTMSDLLQQDLTDLRAALAQVAGAFGQSFSAVEGQSGWLRDLAGDTRFDALGANDQYERLQPVLAKQTSLLCAM